VAARQAFFGIANQPPRVKMTVVADGMVRAIRETPMASSPEADATESF
jgi:hypothetical protein